MKIQAAGIVLAVTLLCGCVSHRKPSPSQKSQNTVLIGTFSARGLGAQQTDRIPLIDVLHGRDYSVPWTKEPRVDPDEVLQTADHVTVDVGRQWIYFAFECDGQVIGRKEFKIRNSDQKSAAHWEIGVPIDRGGVIGYARVDVSEEEDGSLALVRRDIGVLIAEPILVPFPGKSSETVTFGRIAQPDGRPNAAEPPQKFGRQ